MKLQVSRTALWMSFAVIMSLTMVDQAFAGFVSFTPPVPEIDGPGGIAAIALLASVAAIFFGRSRNRGQ